MEVGLIRSYILHFLGRKMFLKRGVVSLKFLFTIKFSWKFRIWCIILSTIIWWRKILTLKFYQFLYFYMELFNTDPDPTHYFGMNPWWLGSFRIFTYLFPFSFLMVSAFESNLEFEDNGKGKLSTLGGAPGWWCGPTSIRSKIRCIPSGALRTFTLRHSAAPPFSHGQMKTGKFTPTRNVGCNGNALVNCIPLSDFAKYRYSNRSVCL